MSSAPENRTFSAVGSACLFTPCHRSALHSIALFFIWVCWPCWTRTSDALRFKQALYHLS